MSSSEARPKPAEKPTFDAPYWPTILDYALRWIALELWRYGLIHTAIFWGLQIVAIPVLIASLIFPREERLKKKYGIASTLLPEDTPLSMLLMAFVVFSGAYITYTLAEGRHPAIRILFAAIVVVVYGFYAVVLHITPVASRSKEDRMMELRALEEALARDEDEAVDANNIRIARMETEINSISQRVESYTLESALFGGLAFSGFLTLISADDSTLPKTRLLVAHLSAFIRRVAEKGFSGIDFAAVGSLSLDELLAAISLETLVCSMFFVSVIVMRLHFYGILKKVDYAVRVARTYNDKEDEVHHLCSQAQNPTLQSRLERLTGKVADAIDHAEPLFRDLTFIMNYMRGFRSLGIGSFVLILITSAFLLARPVGVAFTVVIVFAYTYSYADHIWRDRRINQKAFFQSLEARVFSMSRSIRRDRS